jgi:hypothetical protein
VSRSRSNGLGHAFARRAHERPMPADYDENLHLVRGSRLRGRRTVGCERAIISTSHEPAAASHRHAATREPAPTSHGRAASHDPAATSHRHAATHEPAAASHEPATTSPRHAATREPAATSHGHAATREPAPTSHSRALTYRTCHQAEQPFRTLARTVRGHAAPHPATSPRPDALSLHNALTSPTSRLLAVLGHGAPQRPLG